jgi:hypothetical protein
METTVNPTQKIQMALLAAKLAQASLELITVSNAEIARLQFSQIVLDLRELDKHIRTL